MKENWFDNLVCRLVAILCRPQYAKAAWQPVSYGQVVRNKITAEYNKIETWVMQKGF